MSDKKDYSISPSLSRQLGIPPTAAYGTTAPVVSYGQMAVAPPPSYSESLTHPIVASQPGAPHQYPQYSPATAAAAASAQQLQMNFAAAQQAQKVAYAQQQAFQQHPMYIQQPTAYPQQVTGYYPAHAAAMQPGQNVLVMNGYDTGARFDGIAQQSIPPPPPGIAPNAAQLAAAAGAQVSVSQKKNSFLTGGSGGGYTFW
ncbi:DAZ-associated protein 2 isoform X2 [Macrobrachium rosenbergii]|uniref:DAZ-associated protein 2 isoform X2 n=1 Tax=Macrobrachium rosenbergii TaxID=79674 RepID=UPI0034D632DF